MVQGNFVFYYYLETAITLFYFDEYRERFRVLSKASRSINSFGTAGLEYLRTESLYLVHIRVSNPNSFSLSLQCRCRCRCNNFFLLGDELCGWAVFVRCSFLGSPEFPYRRRDWPPWLEAFWLSLCPFSVVAVATGYGLDYRRVGVLGPVGSRMFISPYRPYRFWGTHNLLSNGYWGAVSPGVKRPGRHVDRFPPISAEVKKT
jgi:hypothetical protein